MGLSNAFGQQLDEAGAILEANLGNMGSSMVLGEASSSYNHSPNDSDPRNMEGGGPHWNGWGANPVGFGDHSQYLFFLHGGGSSPVLELMVFTLPPMGLRIQGFSPAGLLGLESPIFRLGSERE